MVSVRRISSSSVLVSWRMKNANNGGVYYYLVTYYRTDDESDKHTLNTTDTEATISGLQPGASYKFAVGVCCFPVGNYKFFFFVLSCLLPSYKSSGGVVC